MSPSTPPTVAGLPAVSVERDGTIQEQEASVNAQRRINFSNGNEDDDEDEFAEPDTYVDVKESVDTCKVICWKPKDHGHGDVEHKIGGMVIVPTKPFMDKVLTHVMLYKSDNQVKQDFMKDMGTQLVPRVISASVDGEVLQTPGRNGGMYNLQGLAFTFATMNKEKATKFLKKRVVPNMKKYKQEHWSMKEANEPQITVDGNEYSEVTKLSHVLTEEQDIHWFLSHATKRQFKKWGTRANIYNVWDEGSVPPTFIRTKGINKNVLLAADYDKYEAKYGEESAAKKHKS